MDYYLIVCKSLTNAKRGMQCLRNAGIRSSIVRLPEKISNVGCGYTLRVSEEKLDLSLTQLIRCGLKYKRVYLISGDGVYNEVMK